MSYQNGTTHYNLPQTIGSDKRDWSDTNKAYADIDSAIYTAKNGVETLTPQISVLQSGLSDVKENVATNTSDIANIGGRVTSTEQNINNINNMITDVRNDSEDMITSYREHSATASRNYNIGDYFIYNNTLYIATRQITQNSTIVPNTNCNTVTVMSELKSGSHKLMSVGLTIPSNATFGSFAQANESIIRSTLGTSDVKLTTAHITCDIQQFTDIYNLERYVTNGDYIFIAGLMAESGMTFTSINIGENSSSWNYTASNGVLFQNYTNTKFIYTSATLYYYT